MRLVLIDDRIEEYENIIASLTANTDAIVFSYKNDTIEDIQSRITKKYASVAIIQHKIESRTYRFVGSTTDAILYDLETEDPQLLSWEPYIAFLQWLVTDCDVQFVDLLACNLWADANWKYAITTIRELCDVYIRASIDITGEGGNFILESDGIDTIGVYFNESIQEYKHSFFASQDPTAITAFISWYEHNAVLFNASQSATVSRAYGKYAYPYTGEPVLENVNTIIQCAGSTSTIYVNNSMTVLSGGFVGPPDSVKSRFFNVKKVVGNGYWNAALLYDGTVLAWGSYGSDNILVPSTNIVSWTEVQYQLLDIIDIIAFNNSFIALKRTQTIVGWGLKSELPWYNGVDTSLFTSIIKLLFNGQGCILERAVNGVSKYILLRSNAFTYTGNNTQNVFPIIEFIRTSDANTCYLLLEKPGKDLIITNFTGSIIVYDIPTNVYVLRYITGISTGIVFVVFSNFSVIKIVNNTYTLFNNVCDITVNNARFAMLGTDGYMREYNDSSNIPRSVYGSPDVGSIVSTGNTIGILYLDGTFMFTGTLNGQSTTSMNSICRGNTILYILMTTNIRKVWGFYNSYEFIKTDGAVLRVFNDLTYTYTPAPSPINGFPRDVYIIPGVSYGIPVEYTIIAPVILPQYVFQDTLVTISYTVGYTAGCAMYGRLYKLYVNGVRIGKYVPTEDTFTYTFSNVLVPIRGNAVQFTIIDCTYPNRRTVATFIKTVLLPKNTPFIKATHTTNNRIYIPGLVNGKVYTIFLKSYTATGNSITYSTVKVKPVHLDFSKLPTLSNNRLNISGLTNNQTYTIFIRSYNASSSGMAYSTIVATPKASPFTFYDAQVSANNLITIPNLIDGQLYTVILKSYNAMGDSDEYSYIQGTPLNTEYNQTPLPENNQLSIAGLTNDKTYTIFLRSYNLGGASKEVIKLLVKPFKLDFFNASSTRMIENEPSTFGISDRSFRSVNTDNRLIIPDLVDGQQYTVFIKSYNKAGESVAYSYAVGTPLDLQFQKTTQYDNNRILISGLTNGQTYTIFLKSYNVNGNSYTYSKQIVVPCTVPNAPTLLDITPLYKSIRVEFTPPNFDGGRPVNDYLYSVDGGITYEYMGNVISPYTITGLSIGNSYSVSLKAVNIRGYSEPSEIKTTILYSPPKKPSITRTIPLDQSVQIFFKPYSLSETVSIIDYLYSVDGGNTFTSMGTTVSPYIITGLTNGITYSLAIRSVSIGGNSVSSTIKPVIPYSVPDAPTISTIVALEDTFVVSFDTPFDGGNTITDYLYSVDNGNLFSYTGTTVSPYNIDNYNGSPLVRGGYYTIVLRAVNSRGYSLSSIARPTVLYTYPGKPTLSTRPLNETIRLSFYTSYDGGNTISNYLYSIDGGNSYSSMETVVSPYFITGLTNFVTYTVSILAVNARGNSVVSDYRDVTPVTTPDIPTITKLVSLNNSIRVEFEPSAFDIESGMLIVDYLYSIDAGNSYVYMGTTQSPYVITNLVNGTAYYIHLRASNYSGNSSATPTYTIIPYTVPDTPTINRLTPLYKSIRMNFTAPLVDGGNAITDYIYSLNGGSTYISANTTLSPFVIPNINNSNTYSITLSAVNYAGNSVATASKTITPYMVPDAPTITSVIPLKNQANLYFQAPAFDGGTPITNYLLSIDNGASFSSIGNPASPYLITGLTNGVQYIVSLRAVNALGTSAPSGNASVIPYTVPAIPIINSIVPLSNAIDISFSRPIVDGGSPITGYSYSINGLNYISMGPTPITYRASGLTNGTTYPVTIIATNILGNSLPAGPIEVKPYTVPNPPILNTVIANSGSVDVSFSAPAFDGGNAIVDYAYSITGVNGNFISIGLDIPPPLYRISNLVNGNSYTIAIKATNNRGVSSASNTIITVPYTVPNPPTIGSLIPYNSAFDISFSAPAFNGGNTIIDYAYSITGPSGTFINMGSTNTLYRVSNLVNGTTYTVYIKAINARGYSNVSSSATTIPYSVPNPPTITALIANDGSIDVLFTRPTYDGGNAITDYAYALNGSTLYISMETNDPATIYRIRDLSNAIPYTVSLKASNYRGYSSASNSITTVPYRIPDAPVIYELFSLPNAIDISFSAPAFNGGNTITNYEYSLDQATFVSMAQSTNRQYTISGLVDGKVYTIYLRAINARGSSTISAPKSQLPITPANAPVITQTDIFDTSVTIYFYVPPNNSLPITNFFYSINGGTTYISLNRNYNAPFTITGLTSGQTYSIVMKTAIVQILSVASTPVLVTPYRVPDAPTIKALIPNDGSIDVSFSAPTFNGGITITDYVYSINNIDYISMGTSNTSALYRINLLTNAIPYIVSIKAVNARGQSVASATKTTIPYRVPDAPTITELIPLPASLDIVFSPPAFNGGNTITNYMYSTNGTIYSYMNQSTNTTYRVLGLTDGVSYNVFIKAINARGNSEASTSLTTIPYRIPDPPTFRLVSKNQSLDIVYSAPLFDGGNAITQYLYSMNDGVYTYMSDIAGTYTVSDLLNSNVYSFRLQVINSRGNSVPTAIQTAIPRNVPDAPAIQSLIPFNASIQVNFIAPAFDGGDVLTDYTYSIDGGLTYQNMNSLVSPFLITGLSNGTQYSITICALNYRGNSEPAPIQTIIPFTLPDTPIINAVIPLDRSAEIDFAPPFWNGGNTITDYTYSIDGGLTYQNMNSLVSPFLITGLSNGTPYSITICALNYRGNSEPAPVQTVIPYTIPDTPIIRQLVPLTSSIRVELDNTFNGGNAISKYAYSLDGGNTFEYFNTITSPLLVYGLINATTYTVSVIAINARGNSQISNSNSTIPFDVPDAPTITRLKPGINALQVFFTAPTFDGGNAISDYAYSIDNGITYTPMGQTTTEPYIIYGLYNFQPYNVNIVAINPRGSSVASNTISARPSFTPGPSTILELVPQINAIDIRFSPPEFDGGNPIINYLYSINNGAYVSMNQSTTETYTVSRLTNGTVYFIKIKAENDVGISNMESPAVFATPFDVPDPPTITQYDSSNQTITIQYERPAWNGGKNIIGYKYSIGGDTQVNPANLIPIDTLYPSPFTISNLYNGTTYYVSVVAVNLRGNSALSNRVYVTPKTIPESPVINAVIPINRGITLRFSPPLWNGGNTVVDYTYILNGNVSADTFTSSPYTITGLINGEAYDVGLYSRNSVGTSLEPTMRYSIIPYTVPDKPVIESYTANGSLIRLTFSGFNGGRTLISVKYSVNGSSFLYSALPINNTVELNQLQNGTVYAIRIILVNIAGDSIPSDTSIITTIPVAPVMNTLTPGRLSLIANIIPGKDEGNSVTSYEYAASYILNGDTITAPGSVLVADLADPTTFTIPNLAYNVLYSVSVRSVNSAGKSEFSNTAYGIPADVPEKPTITRFAKGNGEITIYFTLGDPRGYPVTECTYVLYETIAETLMEDNTETILDTIDSPFVITDVVNGVTYGVAVKAKNAVGYSDLSDRISAAPFTRPSPPIITNLNSYNNSAQVEIAYGDNGGSDITNVWVAVEGPSSPYSGFSYIGPNKFSFFITSLLNENDYTLKIKAENIAGMSDVYEEVFRPHNQEVYKELVKRNSELNSNSNKLSKRQLYALTVRINKGKTRYI